MLSHKRNKEQCCGRINIVVHIDEYDRLGTISREGDDVAVRPSQEKEKVNHRG
jgi:hypothetical protein